MLRKTAIGLSGIIVVLLAVGLGVFIYLRSSLPQMDGSIVLAGLNKPVEIIRDSNAVPHIFAETAEDAYFALGFVHAQDRLWQMEFTRRLGAGRLAEVLGEPALKTDRYLRTLGIYRLAKSNYDRLSPKVRDAYDAYAAGVNAWLHGQSGALPPEFLLLGIEPEPWQPADSLVWGRLMALRLGRNWRSEALRAGILGALAEKGLPSDRLDWLWPGTPGSNPSTIENVHRAARQSQSLLASIPTDEVFDGASNAWALHGTRTSSGKPLLANDPHLAFGAPVLWYLVRIETPGLSITGVTFPGAPLTVLGHNDQIAWAFTNGYGDNEDLFIETISPGDPDAYLTHDGPRKFTVREEVIKVKNADPVRLRVRETYHGPVISDVSEDAVNMTDEGTVTALASPMFRKDDGTVEALYAINRAKDWTGFLAAAAQFHTPQTNIMFASTNGDIGFIAAGRLPLRISGDGRFPVPGKDGTHDWLGFIPSHALPQALNPPSGHFVNANNRSVPMGYPYLVTKDWPPPHRANRILELLDAMNAPGVDDMQAVQDDVQSPVAQRWLPLMLRIEPRGESARQAVDMLANWDYFMRRERAEPLIYTAWLRQFIVALVDDELGPKLVDGYLKLSEYPGLGLVEAALTNDSQWCDDIASTELETCEDILEMALQRALDEIAGQLGSDISKWHWGDLHRATFTHRILTNVPIVRWFADLSIESDGGDHTINRGTTPRARPGNSFKHMDGSGYRAVYDLANLDNSTFMIATGQSGNVMSPHYDDLLRRWRDGQYIRITKNHDDVQKSAIGTLLLVPADVSSLPKED